MQWLAILFALLAGAANPFQTGANAELKTQLAQPLWATAWVYASGLLGVLVWQAFARQPLPATQQIHSVPWWGWAGGAVSILATYTGLAFAQQLGAGTFTGITITVSVAVSIALDHYGLLGFKPHPASAWRIAGALLMAAGIWMVAKFCTGVLRKRQQVLRAFGVACRCGMPPECHEARRRLARNADAAFPGC